MELELLRDGRPVHRVQLQARLTIGRDPGNDLLLVDGDVSGHHAVIASGPGGAVIRDLRSTNGTFVNGQRITTTCALVEGDLVRLGSRATLRVVGRIGAVLPALPVLLDEVAGIRIPFTSDRLTLGSSQACAVVIPGSRPREATLMLDPDGRVHLGTRDGARELAVGDRFVVGGHSFVLEARPGRLPTERPEQLTRYPYRVVAELGGGSGTLARFEHLEEERAHQIRSDQRAALVYLCARQLSQDRAAGLSALRAGWCDDDTLCVGVWGRAGRSREPGALNVLIHRVRREIDTAGFDPWCLEKRRGALRLRVDAALVRSPE